MSFGAITVFLALCTIVLCIWFFRAKDDEYTEQKNILFDKDELKKQSEEGRHE